MPSLSLYVHIPFCQRRCPYCSFYHVPLRDHEEAAFVQAFLKELKWTLDGADVEVRTVYFGGGTPSALSRESWSTIFGALLPYLSGDRTEEITCEVNPEDVTADLIDFFIAAGVNRLSLGIQSMDVVAQKRINRCSPAVNRTAIELSMERCGNVNFDVLLGIPGRTVESLESTIAELVDYRAAHLSVYCLEPGGDLGRDVERFFAAVDPDGSAEEYLRVCDRLEQSGYRHYEVSNFAVAGFESRHNRAYWNGGEYIGLGPGAHSYLGGRRFHNPPSLENYLEFAGDDPTAARIHDDIAAGEVETERLMLALRTAEGVSLEALRCSNRVIDDILECGLAVVANDRLTLTNRGFLVLNEIVLRLQLTC